MSAQRTRLRFFVSFALLVMVAFAGPALATAEDAPAPAPALQKAFKKKINGQGLEGFEKAIKQFADAHNLELKRGVDMLAELFEKLDTDGDGTLNAKADKLGNFEIQDLMSRVFELPALDDAGAVDSATGGCKSDADCPVGYHCHKHQGESGTCAKDGT